MGPRSAALEREVERLRADLNAARGRATALEDEARRGEAHARHMARLLSKEGHEREQAQRRAQELEVLLTRARHALERRLQKPSLMNFPAQHQQHNQQLVATNPKLMDDFSRDPNAQEGNSQPLQIDVQAKLGQPERPEVKASLLEDFRKDDLQRHLDSHGNGEYHQNGDMYAIEMRTRQQRERYLSELNETRDEVRDALERLHENYDLVSERNFEQQEAAHYKERLESAMKASLAMERNAQKHHNMAWVLWSACRAQRRRLLARAFSSWRLQTERYTRILQQHFHKTQQERQTSILTAERGAYELASHKQRKAAAFHSWLVNAKVHRKGKAQALRRIIDNYNKRRLLDAWSHLYHALEGARHAEMQQKVSEIACKASLRCIKFKTLCRTWLAWSCRVLQRKTARATLNVCLRAFRIRKLRGGFNAWKICTRKQSSLHLLFIKLWKKMMSAALRNWYEWAIYNVRHHEQSGKHEFRYQTICDKLTQREVVVKNVACILIYRLMERYHRGLQRRGFDVLCRNAQYIDSCEIRLLRKKSRSCFIKESLHTFFNEWAGLMKRKKLAERFRLQISFNTFRERIIQRMYVARAVDKLRKMALRKALASWKRHLIRRTKFFSLLHNLRRLLLRQTFSRWSRVSILKGRDYTMDLVAQGVVSLAHASSARGLAALFRMKLFSQKKLAFERWTNVVLNVRSIHLERSTIKLASTRQLVMANMWSTHYAFAVWKKVVLYPVQAARHLYHALWHCRTRRAFNHWRIAALRRTNMAFVTLLQEDISSYLGHRRQFALKRYFLGKWSMFVAQRKLLLRLVSLREKSLCSVNFAKWRELQACGKQLSRLNIVAVSFVRRRALLRSAFRVWLIRTNRYSLLNKLGRSLFRISAQIHRRHVLKMAFNKLLTLTQIKVDVKIYKKKLIDLDAASSKLFQAYTSLNENRKDLGISLLCAHLTKHCQYLLFHSFALLKANWCAIEAFKLLNQNHLEIPLSRYMLVSGNREQLRENGSGSTIPTRTGRESLHYRKTSISPLVPSLLTSPVSQAPSKPPEDLRGFPSRQEPIHSLASTPIVESEHPTTIGFQNLYPHTMNSVAIRSKSEYMSQPTMPECGLSPAQGNLATEQTRGTLTRDFLNRDKYEEGIDESVSTLSSAENVFSTTEGDSGFCSREHYSKAGVISQNYHHLKHGTENIHAIQSCGPNLSLESKVRQRSGKRDETGQVNHNHYQGGIPVHARHLQYKDMASHAPRSCNPNSSKTRKPYARHIDFSLPKSSRSNRNVGLSRRSEQSQSPTETVNKHQEQTYVRSSLLKQNHSNNRTPAVFIRENNFSIHKGQTFPNKERVVQNNSDSAQSRDQIFENYKRESVDPSVKSALSYQDRCITPSSNESSEEGEESNSSRSWGNEKVAYGHDNSTSYKSSRTPRLAVNCSCFQEASQYFDEVSLDNQTPLRECSNSSSRSQIFDRTENAPSYSAFSESLDGHIARSPPGDPNIPEFVVCESPQSQVPNYKESERNLADLTGADYATREDVNQLKRDQARLLELQILHETTTNDDLEFFLGQISKSRAQENFKHK